MALIKCHSCGTTKEFSFFDHWSCYECGAGDWYISLVDFDHQELLQVYSFYQKIHELRKLQFSNSIVPVTIDFESIEPHSLESLIDTSLLFFDTIIVPDYSYNELSKNIGEDKFKIYYENNCIKCSDNSFRTLETVGSVNYSENTTKKLKRYDFQLDDPILDNEIPEKVNGNSASYNIYISLDNLETLYFKELFETLNKFKIKYTPFDGINAPGYRPKRFIRNELFCYLYGATLYCDQNYNKVNSYRELKYSHSTVKNSFNYKIFREWLRTTKLQKKKIDHNSVIEFRDKYGSMNDLMQEIRTQSKQPISEKSYKRVSQELASEIENRVIKAKKIKGKSHDKKAVYLTGLLSSLGALIGGTSGALIGGIGSSALSQLALEYDRKIPGAINFIEEQITY